MVCFTLQDDNSLSSTDIAAHVPEAGHVDSSVSGKLHVVDLMLQKLHCPESRGSNNQEKIILVSNYTKVSAHLYHTHGRRAVTATISTVFTRWQ